RAADHHLQPGANHRRCPAGAALRRTQRNRRTTAALRSRELNRTAGGGVQVSPLPAAQPASGLRFARHTPSLLARSAARGSSRAGGPMNSSLQWARLRRALGFARAHRWLVVLILLMAL